MMLITGSTPREDGLPVEAYRTLKVMEVFHVSVRRHIYVLGFETDDRSRQMTGHQNMTNAERLKFEARYRPHASPLVVRVDASVYNGWYTENGSGKFCTMICLSMMRDSDMCQFQEDGFGVHRHLQRV